MKKRKVLAAVMALLMAVMLAACSQRFRGDQRRQRRAFKLKNLPKNEFVETQAKFNFDDAVITVELEGGTVDIGDHRYRSG